MAKTKSRQLHKIKIHHNRWMIWAIAYVLFITIALVGYMSVVSTDTENQSESNFTSYRSYSSEPLGFGIRYPGTWSIEAESESTISFLPSELNDSGITVSVTEANTESSVRRVLNIDDERSIEVAGVIGTKIKNEVADGVFETVVLVENNNRLYTIRGSENLVERLLLTFRFID